MQDKDLIPVEDIKEIRSAYVDRHGKITLNVHFKNQQVEHILLDKLDTTDLASFASIVREELKPDKVSMKYSLKTTFSAWKETVKALERVYTGTDGLDQVSEEQIGRKAKTSELDTERDLDQPALQIGDIVFTDNHAYVRILNILDDSNSVFFETIRIYKEGDPITRGIYDAKARNSEFIQDLKLLNMNKLPQYYQELSETRQIYETYRVHGRLIDASDLVLVENYRTGLFGVRTTTEVLQGRWVCPKVRDRVQIYLNENNTVFEERSLPFPADVLSLPETKPYTGKSTFTVKIQENQTLMVELNQVVFRSHSHHTTLNTSSRR